MPRKPTHPVAVFKCPPEIEYHLSIRGQSYWLARITPWPCRNGRQSHVLTWLTQCAKCGTGFAVTSGMTIDSLNKRCPPHRRKQPTSLRGKIVLSRFVAERLLMRYGAL